MGARLQVLLSPDDDEGVWFDYSMLAFLFADISMVVIESDKAWRASLGDEIFANLEGVAAMIFSFLYILRKHARGRARPLRLRPPLPRALSSYCVS